MQSNIVAPFLLRAYAWEVLKANTNLVETDYEGKVPIVPLAEREDILKYGKPYLVYAYSEQGPVQLSARNVGNMAFVVNSTSFSTLAKVTNVLTRVFERADESARDVNEFSSTIPSFVGIRFGTITVALAQVDEPEETEGSNMQGVVNVRYEYYTNYDGLVTSVAHWDTQSQTYVKN